MNWRTILDEAIKEARNQGQRVMDGLRGDRGPVTELMRPNLSGAPQPIRRVLEPVVAVAAVGALAAAVAVGAMSLFAFMVAGALIYGILTQVFGLELEMDLPIPQP